MLKRLQDGDASTSGRRHPRGTAGSWRTGAAEKGPEILKGETVCAQDHHRRLRREIEFPGEDFFLQLRLDRQDAEESDSEPLPEPRVRIHVEGLRRAVDDAVPQKGLRPFSSRFSSKRNASFRCFHRTSSHSLRDLLGRQHDADFGVVDHGPGSRFIEPMKTMAPVEHDDLACRLALTIPPPFFSSRCSGSASCHLVQLDPPAGAVCGIWNSRRARRSRRSRPASSSGSGPAPPAREAGQEGRSASPGQIRGEEDNSF